MIGITLTAISGKKYTTVDPLGAGGFGTVFVAHDENGNQFALKLIAPAVAPDAIATFRQEIESTAGLEHPNILRVIDWGDAEIKGQPALFVISELCSEGDYRKVVNRYASTGFPIDSIVSGFIQILSGLAVLHSKVVHRDIKPENVLRAGAVLKVGDYGLAKFVEEATRTLTFKNAGTPVYMAPEVWLHQTAGIATDLYAVGVMLFEALTGRPPYVAADLLKLRDEHLYSPIPRPKSINPKVPDYLDGIVKKLLAKSAGARYQSAKDAIEALAKLGGGGAASPAIRDIAARARQYHDRQEAESLEALKNLSVADEDRKRNLFAQQELLSAFDNAVEEINEQLPEIRIARADSFEGLIGRAWKLGTRIITIWFLDLRQSFGRIDPSLASILRAKNVTVAGYIKITDNGDDREGWNVVQVRSADAAYGEWKLIETRTWALARTPAPEIQPFAVEDVQLLAENLAIHWKRVTHVYSLKETPLESSDILRLLSLLVPRS